jgi:hypothetical protein
VFHGIGVLGFLSGKIKSALNTRPIPDIKILQEAFHCSCTRAPE